MAVCCLLPAREAQAATAKKLFSIVVNDGFVSQTVPVYQYTESNGTNYVAAKKTLRTLPVYAGAKTVKISISGKTSLYKNTFKSISYKKSAALSSSTSLTFTLKQKDGKRKTAVLKLQRPAMPKISSLKTSPTSSAGFTPGNYSRMSVKVSTRSSVAVKAYYKIKNSSGKVVYQKTLGTKKNVNYTAYWDGKPSKGNAAGLSTTDYVPAGTYKLTAFLQYTVGGKNKFISKTVTVKVKNSGSSQENNSQDNTSQNGDTQNGGSTGASLQAKNWSWKVTLTGDDTVDYLAETICQKVLTNNMTEAARAKALYTWCGKNITYSKDFSIADKIDVSSETAKAAVASYGKQADTQIATGKAVINNADTYFPKSSAGMQKTRIGWATKGLSKWRGDCLIMSLSYEILCRHAGITANIVENSLKSGASPGHHFWNVVQIGGKYYYADVNQATESYRTGGLRYDFFLRGTQYYYQHQLYSSVLQTTKYKIAKSVSADDCPDR